MFTHATRDAEASRAGGFHPLDYLRVLYWRRWLAISVFVLVVGAAAAYTFTAPRIYEARTTILIEADEPNIVAFKEVLDEGTSRGGYYETQNELLKSRALAKRTVDAMQLWRRPEFGPTTEASAIAAIASQIQVTPIRGSRLVTLRFRSEHPALAADIVNGHAVQYIQQSMENRYTVAKEATDWLDQQLARERTRVEQADSALQAYRESHDAVSLKNGQDIVVQKLGDLNAAVTKAKTARIDKEVQYRELQSLETSGAALDSFPAILSNPFIQQLKGEVTRLQREYAQLSESLGDRHPTLIEKRTELQTVQKRLDGEVKRVVQSVGDAFRAAQAEEANLTRALEEQKSEALSLNRRGIEYAALERDAESVRLIYQSLLQRARETGVSRELRSTNIRIVDEAEIPKAPLSPRPVTDMSLGVIGGLLLALATVFVVEFLDERLKTPDDVRTHLGAFLGLLPELPKRALGKAPVVQIDGPVSFVEAIRALRTRVVTANGEARSVLVASASQGEGKTLVATNLAVALAESRQRVLLVDADMRRPAVHSRFGHRLEPGLSNALAGSATLADVLHVTSTAGLTIMTAGTPSRESTELLGSSLFNELFAVMQEHYDWIVIDSPPVLSVTDPSILARVAGGVVFVVASARTPLRAARLGIEELKTAGGRVLGAVLNRADLQHHPFYFSPYLSGGYRDPSSSGSRRQRTANTLEIGQ